MAVKKMAEKASLEKNLDKLEALVNTMEEGDLSLEESLKQFEQGIALTRKCQTALKQAEQKVSILMAEQEELADFDFDDEEDEFEE